MTILDQLIDYSASEYNNELMWCRDEEATAWLRLMYELIELRNQQEAA